MAWPELATVVALVDLEFSEMDPTVVVLHAHPDDEAIFTGATIRRAADHGARVVLVCATGGEAGECHIPLAEGENLRRRRLAELERACDLLGVSRLVLLGYHDSGSHCGPYARTSLGAATVSDIAARVERVAREEQAGTLMYYEPGGITGHIDHLQVHRAGRRVVAGLGITGYEATVDRVAAGRGSYPLARSAAGRRRIGTPPELISLSVTATVPELLAKMAAMTAHHSQIESTWLDPSSFSDNYGNESFVRRGGPGGLDQLAGASWPATLTNDGVGLASQVLVG